MSDDAPNHPASSNPSHMNRRAFGRLSALALLAGSGLAGLPHISLAANPTGEKLHGLSAFGELALKPDYPHFGFVNPDAPKGGTFNFSIPNWAFNQNPQTFDTLNTLVLKGNAPPRLELIYDSLMILASDEPSAIYGLLAETVEISEDRNSYTFFLSDDARWHDNTPLTADDVVFTYETLKDQGHPQLALALKDLLRVAAADAQTVTLTFNGKQSDRAILTAAVMPIISRSFYKDVPFESSTMEVPLGSGPYKIKRAEAGRFIEYERVENYWGAAKPFAIGLNNFDVIRIEFYRERQAAFEAFKKGDITYREEFTSKTWSTEYDFPAVQDGRVKTQLFDREKIPSFQGWAANSRRARFANPKTRQAIGLCFDYEWTNRNLFFGIYERSQSYFEGSDFAASGMPSEAELALLNPLRDTVPEEAFGEAVLQPVSNGTGRDRAMLRKANTLLAEAGWKRDGSRMVDGNGDPLTVEILIRSPTFERILGGFVNNMKTLGMEASIRLVDPAQFTSRLETYDFDLVGIAANYGATPTVETLEQFFGSRFAKANGGRNYAGIEDPAVDALIESAKAANNRDELTVSLRALDRVLRSKHSWIPNWYSANHRVAYWEIFGFPPEKPDYEFPVERTWWYDRDKATSIGRG